MLGALLRSPFVAAMVFASALALNPDELLRQSDIGAFAPSSFMARLVLRSLPRGDRHEIEVWRSGATKTLIRFLDSKERGKYLVRLGGRLWLLTPSAKQPVQLNPSYRLYGGATLDEVLGLRLALAYRVEHFSREPDPDGALVALDLRAKADEGVLFPQVHYVIREASQRPVSATYRLRSGKDATVVQFLEWSDTSPVYAKRVVVNDLLHKGALTEVEIVEMQERAVPDELFALDAHAARRELEIPSLRTR